MNYEKKLKFEQVLEENNKVPQAPYSLSIIAANPSAFPPKKSLFCATDEADCSGVPPPRFTSVHRLTTIPLQTCYTKGSMMEVWC